MSLLELLESNNTKEIEKEISLRFVKNMEYFRESSPNLFDALKNEPSEYNLLINDSGINIINLETNNLVYPLEDGISSMFRVNKELAQNPLRNEKWNLKSNGIYLDKMDTKHLSITGEACNGFIDLLFKHGGKKDYFLSKDFLPCTTIFGLLGGMFLEFMREKNVFFHSLLIYEENVDMFRISCYFVDYPALFSQVTQGACFLFVKDLINRFFIRSFFAKQKITNNFLRLELKLYDGLKIDSALQIINEEYASNSRGWGSFEDEMIGIENTIQNLPSKKQKNYFLYNPKKIDMPICVVGNGASLDSNLEFLKINQDRMIIFSCGTAIAPLKAAGIKIDFQIEIERVDYLDDYLKPSLDKTALLCGNMVNPKVLNLAKERYLFMRGGSASGYMFKSPFVIEFCAPFVGNAGFALACQLSNEIVMCGLDCGIIKGGTKHASNSAYGIEKPFEISKNALRVRGNFDAEVYSDALQLLSAQVMAQTIKVLNPQIVLNLGNGAYIEGARPTKENEFSLANNKKSKFVKQIKSYFSNNKGIIFSDYREDFYLSEIIEYKNQIESILNEDINDKKELYKWVDMVFEMSAKKSQKSPYVGILFEGSLAHICQNLMMATLHLPSNVDIKNFINDARGLIIQALNKMILKYKMFTSIYREKQ